MTPIRWRHWVSALGILVLGAAAGITADRVLHRSGNSHGRLLEEVRRDPVAVMQRELGLTPEQRTRVAAILESRQGHFDSIWADTHHRLAASLDSLVSEIAAVLDSSQVGRFRALVDEVHSAPGSLPGEQYRLH
jgi:hypothetical protein